MSDPAAAKPRRKRRKRRVVRESTVPEAKCQRQVVKGEHKGAHAKAGKRDKKSTGEEGTVGETTVSPDVPATANSECEMDSRSKLGEGADSVGQGAGLSHGGAMDEDRLAQEDELEAMAAIYGDVFCVMEKTSESIACKVTLGDSNAVVAKFFLPASYPSSAAPLFGIQGLPSSVLATTTNQMHAAWEECPGEILYTWIEIVTSVANELHMEDLQRLDELAAREPDTTCPVRPDIAPMSESSDDDDAPGASITSGESFVDRKSIFQGFCASVTTVRQAEAMLAELLSVKKIARATHNIWAYRIVRPDGTVMQNNDDDGETGAGKNLAHLLSLLPATNVMVVVTRWYGGVQLGPDRFKHINNAGRGVLLQAGLIEPKPAASTNKKKKGRRK